MNTNNTHDKPKYSILLYGLIFYGIVIIVVMIAGIYFSTSTHKIIFNNTVVDSKSETKTTDSEAHTDENDATTPNLKETNSFALVLRLNQWPPEKIPDIKHETRPDTEAWEQTAGRLHLGTYRYLKDTSPYDAAAEAMVLVKELDGEILHVSQNPVFASQSGTLVAIWSFNNDSEPAQKDGSTWGNRATYTFNSLEETKHFIKHNLADNLRLITTYQKLVNAKPDNRRVEETKSAEEKRLDTKGEQVDGLDLLFHEGVHVLYSRPTEE